MLFLCIFSLLECPPLGTHLDDWVWILLDNNLLPIQCASSYPRTVVRGCLDVRVFCLSLQYWEFVEVTGCAECNRCFAYSFILKIGIFLQYSFYMILFCTFKNILITLNKTADFATFLKGSSSKWKTYIIDRGKMYLGFASPLSHPSCKQLTYFVLKHVVQYMLMYFETCIIKLSL